MYNKIKEDEMFSKMRDENDYADKKAKRNYQIHVRLE